MKKIICALAALCALTACSNNSDLKKWMNDEKTKARNSKKQPEAMIPPVFKKYDPEPFKGLNAFNPKRMENYRLSKSEENRSAEKNDQGDVQQATPFLTTILLDQLAYKGMIDLRPFEERCLDNLCQGIKYVPCTQPRACFALVKDKGTQKTYKVTVGDAMGQNGGTIKEIGTLAIKLDERERSEEGDWVSKVTQISLDRSGNTK